MKNICVSYQFKTLVSEILRTKIDSEFVWLSNLELINYHAVLNDIRALRHFTKQKAN